MRLCFSASGQAACLGLAEIFGITARDDLLLPDEELIWEWKCLDRRN